MQWQRARLYGQTVVAILVFVGPFETLCAQEQSDDEAETSWTATAHSQYANKDVSNGVDMSNDLAVFLYGIRIEHSSGFSLEGGAANLLGTGGGFERWYATLGYSYTVRSWLVLSGELSHFKYADDSLNAIANLSNSVTLAATFQSGIVNVGISYNTYFGGGTATYYGLNFDHTFHNGRLSINPSINVSFVSQTIDPKRLVTFKHGKGHGNSGVSGGTTTSVTVTGLSGITFGVGLSYDLGSGFAVVAQPTYVNSPKAELAANASQFLWSVGLTYAREF